MPGSVLLAFNGIMRLRCLFWAGVSREAVEDSAETERRFRQEADQDSEGNRSDVEVVATLATRLCLKVFGFRQEKPVRSAAKEGRRQRWRAKAKGTRLGSPEPSY